MSIHRKPYGKHIWTFAAGHIPLHSTGREPEFTSHDKIAVMNVSDSQAEIVLRIFYQERDPVQFKKILVEPKRVRKVRFNDLIDPIPLPLDVPFAFVLISNTPVIVQFSRMNTERPALAGICTNAFPMLQLPDHE